MVHPVASSEALDHLHWVMRVVLYRHIAMAIETASKVGVFFHCCVVDCCPGGQQGNTEHVVTQCQRPVASSKALDLLHWVMLHALLKRDFLAVEMTPDGGAFVHCRCLFV